MGNRKARRGLRREKRVSITETKFNITNALSQFEINYEIIQREKQEAHTLDAALNLWKRVGRGKESKATISPDPRCRTTTFGWMVTQAVRQQGTRRGS